MFSVRVTPVAYLQFRLQSCDLAENQDHENNFTRHRHHIYHNLSQGKLLIINHPIDS